MPASINTPGASAIRCSNSKSRIWLGVHGRSLAFMRSGGIEKMGGIRGGKFLLLLLGRLEERLDRLLHRTSRNLEQPVDRSSWRDARPGFPSPFFGALEITLERHQRFEPFALRLGLLRLRHKKSRRKRPP